MAEATRETVYKLTRADLTTHNGYQWVVGEERQFPGNGELCTAAYAHAYRSPALADEILAKGDGHS